MKKRKIALIILLTLIVVYFLGPTPPSPQYNTEIPELPSIEKLEDFVNLKEAQFHTRPGNEAQIVWLDSNKSKTDYSILYLHGFSACHMEGNPIHMNLAKEFGANLYLARLHSHGLATNSLRDFNPEELYLSALEEMAIAEKLGKKLMIMSTSTGGTLALKLASEFPDKVLALINLSPNIKIKNPAAVLLNDPWGADIAKMVYGGDNRKVPQLEPYAGLYWDSIYPAEATVQLEELLETTMLEEAFNKVTCPVLSLYYYKDEDNQDEVVDIEAIKEMHTMLGTKPEHNVNKGLPTPQNHVIASSIKSKDFKIVEEEITEFCVNTLNLKPESN